MTERISSSALRVEVLPVVDQHVDAVQGADELVADPQCGRMIGQVGDARVRVGEHVAEGASALVRDVDRADREALSREDSRLHRCEGPGPPQPVGVDRERRWRHELCEQLLTGAT